MSNVKIEGIEKLQKKLKRSGMLNGVKGVVLKHGTDMNNSMVRNANFTKGYQTGTTKGSIHLNITDGGLTAESGPTTEYSYYLEYGTRLMEAQPFVKPAWEEEKKKFKKSLSRLVK